MIPEILICHYIDQFKLHKATLCLKTHHCTKWLQARHYRSSMRQNKCLVQWDNTVYLLWLLYWDMNSSLTMPMMSALQTHRRHDLYISIINVHTGLKMQTMSDLTLRRIRVTCCCVKWCQSPVILYTCLCVIIQHAALQIHTYVHDCTHTQPHTDALRGQREGENCGPWKSRSMAQVTGQRMLWRENVFEAQRVLGIKNIWTYCFTDDWISSKDWALPLFKPWEVFPL